MAEPKPLTPGEKRLAIGCLILGPIVLVLGFIYMDDLSTFLGGAIVGGGGGLTAVGFIQLFHRPDRPNRKT